MKNTISFIFLLSISYLLNAAAPSITKNSTPSCTAIITVTPASASVCYGSSVTITASGGASYIWSDGEASSSITISPTATMTVIVTGTDTNGCTGTDTVLITVDHMSLSINENKQLICVGTTDTINATVSGGVGPYTYSWSPSSWLSCTDCSYPVASPGVTTTYTLTVTDSNGCSVNGTITVDVDNIATGIYSSTGTVTSPPCVGTSLTLYSFVMGGASPFVYAWSPGTGTTSSVNITVPATPTTYSLSVTDTNGCSATASSMIIPDNINVILPPTTVMCGGYSSFTGSRGTTGFIGGNALYANVSGGTAPYTYVWNPPSGGPDTAYSQWFYGGSTGFTNGTYTVTVFDAGGCSSSATTIVLLDTAHINITASINEMQPGQNDTLTAHGGISYVWQVQTVNRWWYSTTSTRGNQIVISNSSTSELFCIAYGADSNGCVGTAEYVSTPTKLNISLPANTKICNQQSTDGDNINGLFANVSGGVPPYTFVWTPPVGSNDTTEASWIRNPATGTYSVVAIDSRGNKAYATGNVDAKTPPNVTLTSSANNIQIGQTVILTAGNAVTYKWSTGQTGNSITVTPNFTTLYSVTGWDSSGCAASVISTLSVIDNNDWRFSPDTTIPHLKTFPPIYYAGNVSVGRDSAASPHQALEVHGNTVVDSTLSVTGKVVIGNGFSLPGSYGLYVGNGMLTSLVKIAFPSDTNWSDYVFGNNYKLLPLPNVAQYIKDNKHLPDVPSAKEVSETGIDVAKMDAVLLKKIEELTLYTIQLQQLSQQQQQELEKMKSELDALKAGQK